MSLGNEFMSMQRFKIETSDALKVPLYSGTFLKPKTPYIKLSWTVCGPVVCSREKEKTQK